MFQKLDKVYADTYKYLKHKTKNIFALSYKGNMNDFEELDMDLPLQVKVEGKTIFWQNNRLAIAPKNLDYATIKEHIIKGRYTNDEQIAIILNSILNNASEEANNLYLKMQEWRDFAAKIAEISSTGDKEITEVNGLKEKLFDQIKAYDSNEINSFTLNGINLWFDKDTRAGLRARFEAEKSLGKTETSLWYKDFMFELQIDDALSMLNYVEVYASECYDNTQRHYKTVKELMDVEALKTYDYKKGYPEKLVFG